MSTAVPPLPSEAEQPGLSEPQRIINTFFSPSKTFEDIRRNASWWVPWLLLAIVSVALGPILSKKIDWEQVVREQRENGFSSVAFQGLTKEQQDQQVALGAKIAAKFVYASPVFLLLSGLIMAAILSSVFNFGLEAEVSYKRSLAIVFYSLLPQIFRVVFAIIVLQLRSDTAGLNPNNLVGTNIGYYLDKASVGNFVYGMATAVDVIMIWCIILMGIGFSLNAKPRKLSQGTAITVIVVLYLVYKAAFSALGWV